MKYLKTYEKINVKEPQIGDYVICDEDYDISTNEFKKFIYSTIGQCVNCYNDGRRYPYEIEYQNIDIPSKFMKNFSNYSIVSERPMKKKDIKYWSNNKKDLELIIQANKYNI